MENTGFDLIKNSDSWMVNIDGPERRQLEQHLMKIEEVERNIIFLTAAKILGNCPNPYTLKAGTIGLALGKVQSGKTGSFIALTALAFDNKYRIVVIIAGTKKNLLNQTKKRINRQLNLEHRSDRKIALVSTADRMEDVQEQEIKAILESGNNVIITILKQHVHINHISQIFSNHEINHYPTLIIDDEGDQASLNNKTKKGKLSTTYKELTSLINVFNLHSFVAFTATPQANLLIDTFDVFSPKFCVLVEPGVEYTGGSTFHGDDHEKYVRIIPEQEIPFEDQIPDSFIKALGIYFVGAAIRFLRGDLDYHSMLVHTSGSKKDHKNVGDKIKILIEKWKSALSLPKNDPARESIEYILKSAYNDITKNSCTNYAKWEIVANQVPVEMKHLITWIINSAPNAETPNDKLNLKNNIFIGGNMLERGVTLDGLAVTYITRRAKVSQADTVEQRARWFGYKRSYLDLCRVFAPKDVNKGFSDLLGDEDDLWLSLNQNVNEGISIELWPRVIQCSSPFRPTRPSVASVKKVKYERWTYQTKVEIQNDIAVKNVEIVEGFFEKQNYDNMNFGGTEHSVITNLDLNELLENLLGKIITTRKDDDAIQLIKIILRRLIDRNDQLKIDVVLMNKGKTRVRKYSSNSIDQMMQGPNKKYPGDTKILNDKFQLQIHILCPTTPSKETLVDRTVAMALYIPGELLENMPRMVKPSGL